MKKRSFGALVCALVVSGVAHAEEPLPPLPAPAPAPAQSGPTQAQPAPMAAPMAPAPMTAAPAASQGPKPSSGTGLIIAGAALSGVGAVNLATSPLCKADSLFPNKDVQDTCFVGSLVLGGVFLAVGVPLLIVGLNKHSTYEDWKKQHAALAGFGLVPAKSGGALAWSAAF